MERWQVEASTTVILITGKGDGEMAGQSVDNSYTNNRERGWRDGRSKRQQQL